MVDYQIDSRLVGKGSTFFAIKGEKTDGHFHLEEVARRGGALAIVDQGYTGPSFGLKLRAVPDVVSELQDMARDSLRRFQGRVLGITGSVGKTTTRDFLATLLGVKYRVSKSPKNYNTKLTLPLTVLNRREDAEVLVLEMGMSEPFEIEKLVSIAPPDVAILTKVGLSHSAFFPGGKEEILRHKAAIFSHFKTRVKLFDFELEGLEGDGFSVSDSRAPYFLDVDGGYYEGGERIAKLNVPFQEPHLRHNALAAISACRELKMEISEIEKGLKFLVLPSMRLQKESLFGALFINDAYNASPESMKAALSSIPMPKKGGKRIALLGSMKELGTFSEKAHFEVGQFARGKIDLLFTLGEETLPLFEAFEGEKMRFSSLRDMALNLKQGLSSGDVVLIKGSRSLQMENVLEILKNASLVS